VDSQLIVLAGAEVINFTCANLPLACKLRFQLFSQDSLYAYFGGSCIRAATIVAAFKRRVAKKANNAFGLIGSSLIAFERLRPNFQQWKGSVLLQSVVLLFF